MYNLRVLDLNEIKSKFFIERDILFNTEAKKTRLQKLQKAMMLSHIEHQTIGIITTLFSGEVVQVYCDLIECADDFVQLKGGIIIPIRAIVDVEY